MLFICLFFFFVLAKKNSVRMHACVDHSIPLMHQNDFSSTNHRINLVRRSNKKNGHVSPVTQIGIRSGLKRVQHNNSKDNEKNGKRQEANHFNLNLLSRMHFATGMGSGIRTDITYIIFSCTGISYFSRN